MFRFNQKVATHAQGTVQKRLKNTEVLSEYYPWFEDKSRLQEEENKTKSKALSVREKQTVQFSTTKNMYTKKQ